MSEKLWTSEMFYNYRRSMSAIVGSGILICLIAIITIGPSLVQQNPYDIAALDLMDAHDLEHLPVCEPGKSDLAVGRITRVAALKALADGLIAASREEHH